MARPELRLEPLEQSHALTGRRSRNRRHSPRSAARSLRLRADRAASRDDLDLRAPGQDGRPSRGTLPRREVARAFGTAARPNPGFVRRFVALFPSSPELNLGFIVNAFPNPGFNLGFIVNAFLNPGFNVGFIVNAFLNPEFNLGFIVNAFLNPEFNFGFTVNVF